MPEPIEFDKDLPLVGLVPTAAERSRYRNVRVTPPLGSAYAYCVVLPVAWHAVDTPSDRTPSHLGSSPTAIGVFSPLSPPYPPVLLSFGVSLLRPGRSVTAALDTYCAREGYEVLIRRPQRHSAGMVVEALASQPESPFGPIKLRLAMFEDGGRLFGLSAMAPVDLYPTFVREMSLALVSFVLVQPLGPRSASDPI